MKNLHHKIAIETFDPLSRNDNSEKTKAIRKYRHHITTREIRENLNVQDLLSSTLDQATQDAFRILEAQQKK